jgi:hypothetical protein
MVTSGVALPTSLLQRSSIQILPTGVGVRGRAGKVYLQIQKLMYLLFLEPAENSAYEMTMLNRTTIPMRIALLPTIRQGRYLACVLESSLIGATSQALSVAR